MKGSGASRPSRANQHEAKADPLAMAVASSKMLTKGETSGSLKLAEKAHALAGEEGHVSIALAYTAALRATGQYGKARKVAEATIAKNPRHAQCLYDYANLVWQHYDDAENAKAYLRRCVECDAGFAAARAMLAEIKVKEASIDMRMRAKARADAPDDLTP